MIIEAVVFDMDGVLVLSVKAHWQAWSDAAREQGVALTHEQFLGFNGLTNPDICRRLFGKGRAPSSARAGPSIRFSLRPHATH